MGITAWASRYRFANARSTEQSEWQLPAAPEKPAPGQRLHALLETSAQPVEPRRPEPEAESRLDSKPGSESPAANEPALSRARALLDGSASDATSGGQGASRAVAQPEAAGSTTSSSASADAGEAPAQALVDPLRFTLSLAVIGGRWWLMLPGERPLSAAGQTLLEQMLRSVALPPSWSPLSRLTWPLMDVPAVDPAGEAREGIQVFCAGQARRHDLAIDGAIVVGDELWSPLLSESAEGDGWVYHALPHPDDLLSSSKAKRDCWPLLQAVARAWQSDARSADDQAPGVQSADS